MQNIRQFFDKNMELQDFSLIETFLFIPGQGYRYLAEHLQRMATSSHILDFNFQEHFMRNQLDFLQTRIPAHHPGKIRITLKRAGQFDITYMPVHTIKQPYRHKRIIFSNDRTDANDLFYYHKTTRRKLYQQQYQLFCIERDYYEVVFCNHQGFVTEGSSSNIFIQLPGDPVIYTPQANTGLLQGIMRARLLHRLPQIEETFLTKEQVYQAKRIWLTNSVRGIVQVFM